MKKCGLSLLSIICFLSAAFGEEIQLFNGKDLTGWEADIPAYDGKTDQPAVFFVEDGILKTTGLPLGHLYTTESYENYTLTIEYRFSKEAGNSGVMIHSTEKRFINNMFPRSLEVQLHSGRAGDFIAIGEDVTGMRGISKPAIVGKKKTSRRTKLEFEAEKPIGQWNTMIIHALGDRVVVTVNGELVNIGTGVTVTKGKIAFQSEGKPVEFRKVTLKKLSL